MIITTTNEIESKRIKRYLGLVTGEAILARTSSRTSSPASATSSAAAPPHTNKSSARPATLPRRRLRKPPKTWARMPLSAWISTMKPWAPRVAC